MPPPIPRALRSGLFAADNLSVGQRGDERDSADDIANQRWQKEMERVPQCQQILQELLKLQLSQAILSWII